jgi:uncharacterized protein
MLLWTLTALAALAGYAGWVEPRRLVVARSRLDLPGWPAGRPPLRLLLLADLHASGPHMTAARLGAIVAAAAAERPDLVLLLGDYVGTHLLKTSRVSPEEVAGELGGIEAPLGLAAVLGNHDRKGGSGRMRRALEGEGIRVLEDEAVRIEGTGGPLWLAGVADPFGRRPNLEKTLAAVDGDDAPVLLLSHSPDVFPQVPPRVALTVAGHTHGGQVRLPWIGPLVTCSAHGNRYARGLVVEEGRRLFVTSGLGTSLLPVRFGCPPEICVLEIGADEEGPAELPGPGHRELVPVAAEVAVPARLREPARPA